jgi:hypothetical protein
MPTAVPTLAEAKDWLNIPHDGDDAKLTSMIASAADEFKTATAVDPAVNGTAMMKTALLERVANMYGYRGDDTVGPSTWFVDTIRRMHNPNGVS